MAAMFQKNLEDVDLVHSHYPIVLKLGVERIVVIPELTIGRVLLLDLKCI